MTDYLTHYRGALQHLSTSPLMFEPIEGGVRVKRVGDHYIDVIRARSNFRIVTTPVEARLSATTRFWCYAGTDEVSFASAVMDAAAWDGALDTEPPGWNTNGQTKERRDRMQQRLPG